MANILITWELGGGLGHVMRVAALARAFNARGCQVDVVLRDLADAMTTNWPEGTRLFQAPRCSRFPLESAPPASFAGILYGNGYHDPNVLNALFYGWSALLDAIEPDIVLTDYSPTVNLIGNCVGIPTVRIGTGFFAPPACSPLPSYLTWLNVDQNALITLENKVLGTINRVIAALGEQYDSLAEAIAPDLDLITSWPELDHYRQLRQNQPCEYIGHEKTSPALGNVKYEDYRIAVYLKQNEAGLDKLLSELNQTGFAAICYVGGGDSVALSRQFPSKTLTFVATPLDLQAAAIHCDLLICHAGSGAVSSFLDEGKPVLMLPQTVEQFIYASAVVATGAGQLYETSKSVHSFQSVVSTMLTKPDYALAAQQLSLRNQSRSADAIAVAVDKTLDFLKTYDEDN